MVNFSSGRFTPGKEPRYALKRRLGEPESLSARSRGCHLYSVGKMQSFNVKVSGTYCYHSALTFKKTFYFRFASQDWALDDKYLVNLLFILRGETSQVRP